MKKMLVLCLMLSYGMPLDAIAGLDTGYDQTDKNKQRNKMIITSVIFIGGIAAIGGIGFYLWRKNKKPADESKKQPDAEHKGLQLSKRLSYQAYDLTKFRITATDQINDQATENLKQGYATNNWPLIKKSIADGGLNSMQADALFEQINSANGLYYYAANYPRNLRSLLEKHGNNRLQNEIKNQKNPALIEALINVGSDVDILEMPARRTLLMLAAMHDDAKTFVVLVAHGADLNTHDYAGKDVWHYISEDSSLIKEVANYEAHYKEAVASIQTWVRKKM